MFCSKCGTKAIEGADFCQKCGAKLIKDAEPQSNPEPRFAPTLKPTETTAPPVGPMPPLIKMPPQTEPERESIPQENFSQDGFSSHESEKSSLQSDIDQLVMNRDRCPKIKDVMGATVPKLMRGHTTDSPIIGIKLKGTFFNYIYYQGRNKLSATQSLLSYAIWIPLVLCDGLFLTFFFQSEYYFALTLCFLIGCITWIPYLLGCWKEQKEVSSYVSKVLHCDLKPAFSKLALGISAVLNIAGIVLGIIALVLGRGEIGDESGVHYDPSPSESIVVPDEFVVLNRKYENLEEGISFMYPDGWVAGTNVDDTFFTITDGDSLGVRALIAISKSAGDGVSLSGTKEDFEAGYFNAGGFSNVEVVDLSDCELSRYPAKKLTVKCTSIDEISFVSVQYFYDLHSNIYVVTCMVVEEYYDQYEPILGAILDSYTINDINGTLAGGDADSDAVRLAYIEKVRELSAEDASLQFALIDLTKSDEPELIADLNGYYVSVFTWADGEVVCLMDQWPYGAGGNHGYEYLPGQNVIRNFNSDQAGAIIYETYMAVNFAHEVVELPIEQLSKWYFRDTNGNGLMDESEPYIEEPICYYGDTEVSKDVYASYQIEGNYEWISGKKSAAEMLSELGNETNGEGYGDTAPDDLTYEGVSLTDWIGGPADIAYDIFGWPDYGTVIDGSLYEGSEYFGYDLGFNSGITFVVDYQTDRIGWIWGDSGAIECNGVTLDKTRAELIAMLGTPMEEENIYDETQDISYYMMRYILNDTIVDIVMADSTSVAYTVSVSQMSS